MYKLKNCEPWIVFKHFEDICGIPHGSGNEKALSDYIRGFAEDKGLWVVRDEMFNLVVKIPAAKGYENAPVVIVQAHLDMVCEKNKSSSHNFETDPIDVYVEDGWVKANGTTLGADNGIGVAYAMALMEMAGQEDFRHPPLEILLTVLEETGLEGAAFMPADGLNGKLFINVDTEEEGFLRTGCAGGAKPTIHIPVEYIDAPAGGVAYLLEVKGLQGGHSGMEIDKGRGNANRITARLLNELVDIDGVFLANVSGGLKDNAITREAEAALIIMPKNVELCIDKIDTLRIKLENEYRKTDSGLEVLFEPFDYGGKVFSVDSAKRVVSAVMLLPNGPLEMSADFEGIVETSNNVGVVRTTDKAVSVTCAVRSSVASRKEFVKGQINAAARLTGATVEQHGDYPAWEYQPESKLRDIFAKVYKDMHGNEPNAGVMHAGLECGLFSEKIAGLDMISFGPNIEGAHTPGERADIESTRRTWEYFLNVLKAIT